MAVRIGEWELAGVTKVRADFKARECAVFSQLLEFRMLAKLHSRKFERAESGLDEVKAGVTGCCASFMAREDRHVGR